MTSQIITTPGEDQSVVTIPGAAVITDSSDGFRGDIRNASVTFTIEPVTTGASIIGPNTFTIPELHSVNNSNHVRGIASGEFTV